jgi:DNA-binding response OmpR family regulator
MVPVTTTDSEKQQRASEALTKKERELLSILMQNPGRCVTREALLKTVWHYAEGARTRTVDVHVQRLRRKLGREAAASIKTIVRAGYCWFPDPDAVTSSGIGPSLLQATG